VRIKKSEQRFKMKTTGRVCHRMTHMSGNANSENTDFTFPHFAFSGIVWMFHSLAQMPVRTMSPWPLAPT